MTIGELVAKRFKRQYCKRGKWEEMNWEIQPEEYHTILLELKSKKAIECLLDNSWTRRIPKGVKK